MNPLIKNREILVFHKHKTHLLLRLSGCYCDKPLFSVYMFIDLFGRQNFLPRCIRCGIKVIPK